MRNIWLVAKHEYRRVVARRGFLIATLAVPIGIAVLIGVTIFVVSMGENNSPIGYVDNAGFLSLDRRATLPDQDWRLEIRAYENEETAMADLEAESIQAYFVFPADYPGNMVVDLYYLDEAPRNELWREFDDYVRANLVANLSPDVQNRLLEGSEVIVTDVTSNRTFGDEEAAGVILPLVAGMLFFFATMASSGYMLQVVTEEKENRTMEIMVTTLSPGQLIAGKAIGLLASSLTQLGIYVAAAIVGVIIARRYIEALQAFVFPWSYVGLLVLFFIASFALLAGMMITIGAMATGLQQGQQAAGLLNLLFAFPFFILPVIIQSPDSPIGTILTLFPTTAMLTVAMRWSLGSLPLWQVALSFVILVASAVFMIWAAARVFRAGMLRYGQPLTVRGALAAVRQSAA